MWRRHRDLYESMFPHRPTKYTRELLIEIMRTYETRKQFERCERAAHIAALSFFPKLIDEVFQPLIREAGYWTVDRLAEQAAQYPTKEDFRRGNLSAYSKASKLGLLDSFGFIDGATGDYDTVYIWKVVGHQHNGLGIYKIGVTSFRLGLDRIKRVSQLSKMRFEVVALERVGSSACSIEAELLRLGCSPGLSGFCGATEFRVLTQRELDLALFILQNSA